MPLFTQVYKWEPAICWGNLTKLRGRTCRPGEVEILLAASCYRNRDKLRQLWASIGSNAILRKSWEIGRKSSSLACLYIKQNITCPLVDMNFIFEQSTRYLTRSLRSLVRYRVEHEKIKFISTCDHVISSI